MSDTMSAYVFETSMSATEAAAVWSGQGGQERQRFDESKEPKQMEDILRKYDKGIGSMNGVSHDEARFVRV